MAVTLWIVIPTTIVAVVTVLCGLKAWLAYLKLAKHVIDTRGADAAAKALPPIARAFHWVRTGWLKVDARQSSTSIKRRTRPG